ncbi:kelch-like protein 8 [Biomphalaria glabrata]|nr:kelch-like protein 8 [Biomphalaria glabrata]
MRKFEDFEVIVEGEHIKCHSFLLASCSEFFRNLLDSNMKEKQDMKVDLPNVTSKTFKLILNSLYTGELLLTNDNVLDVWAAVHQLQIDFLVQHCEDFIVVNVTVETFQAFKKQADVLQCQRFAERVFPFLCQNFMTLRKSLTFLKLDLTDLMNLIESDQLDVFSEDHVLYSIYDWVSYGNSKSPNVRGMRTKVKANNLAAVSNSEDSNANAETSSPAARNESQIKGNEEDAPLVTSFNQANRRALHLHTLLKSSRYLLASENCIEMLMRNKLTQGISEVKKFWSEIFARNVSGPLHGFWPNAAIHRACSPYEHVAVVCGSFVEAYSFENKSWTHLTSWPMNSVYKAVNLNGRLYGLTRNGDTSELVWFSKNKWSSLLSFNIKMQHLLSHEKCIYIFSSENVITKCQIANEVIRSEPYILETEDFNHSISNADYATSFHKNILVFESIGTCRRARTAVHEWNEANNVWSRVADLDFNCGKMTSFNDETYLYILDKAGSLFRVEAAETVQFSFIEQIWDFRVHLKGAFLFRECLYICGRQCEDGEFVTAVEKVYSSLTFIEKTMPRRCFVPFLMERKSRFCDWKQRRRTVNRFITPVSPVCDGLTPTHNEHW